MLLALGTTLTTKRNVNELLVAGGVDPLTLSNFWVRIGFSKAIDETPIDVAHVLQNAGYLVAEDKAIQTITMEETVEMMAQYGITADAVATIWGQMGFGHRVILSRFILGLITRKI